MRSVHKVKPGKSPRCGLPVDNRNFLIYYYDHICDNPTLDEIKVIAEDLQVKKETIYWWFVNYRKRSKKRMQKSEEIRKNRSVIKRAKDGKTISQDGVIEGEGDDVRVPLAASKRGEGEKKGCRIRGRDTKNNIRTSAAKRSGSLSEKA